MTVCQRPPKHLGAKEWLYKTQHFPSVRAGGGGLEQPSKVCHAVPSAVHLSIGAFAPLPNNTSNSAMGLQEPAGPRGSAKPC